MEPKAAPITVLITRSWVENNEACLGIVMPGETKLPNGQLASVHYIGRVPLAKFQGLSTADQKALLVAAAKAERDAKLAALQPVDLGITGSVVL